MIITFQGQESVYTKTAKGGFTTMTVSYVDETGKSRNWKVISFANPKVFDTFKNAKTGDQYEITTRKNDKDFTEWATADKVGEAPTSGAKFQTKTPAVSQYETRDERNLRQRLIVRQSSLTNAIATLSLGGKSPLNPAEVITVAETYMEWVFQEPPLPEKVPFTDMDNDIPY